MSRRHPTHDGAGIYKHLSFSYLQVEAEFVRHRFGNSRYELSLPTGVRTHSVLTGRTATLTVLPGRCYPSSSVWWQVCLPIAVSLRYPPGRIISSVSESGFRTPVWGPHIPSKTLLTERDFTPDQSPGWGVNGRVSLEDPNWSTSTKSKSRSIVSRQRSLMKLPPRFNRNSNVLAFIIYVYYNFLWSFASMLKCSLVKRKITRDWGPDLAELHKRWSDEPEIPIEGSRSGPQPLQRLLFHK